jgi:hypothetical protein
MRSRWLIACAGLWFSMELSAQIRVAGKVTNDTNAPLVNVSVTFRGVTEDSHRLPVFTDAAGVFAVQLPAAGEYLLTAEAAGYYPQKDRSIWIEADQEVTIALVPVREFSESVDVTAPSSSVTLDQVAAQHRLSGSDVLDVPFPVTHNIKNAMRALPGIVQDHANGIHLNGGGENQALYLLNGFNIGDPLTMRFDARMSIEAIQSMEVASGVVAAEYGKGSAGVIAVNTRTGDDRFRYSATNFVPGVENQKGLRIGSWNPRFNVSGPLQRGRIWFSNNFAPQYDQTIIPELPAGQDKGTSFRLNNFLHVQANLTPSNIASFGFLASKYQAVKTGLGALDPPETTTDRRAEQWFIYGKDQMYFPRGGVAEFGYASNRTRFRQIPQGHDLYVYTPEGRSGNFFVDGRQEAARDQVIASFYAPSFEWAGVHQFKIGMDLNRLSYWQDMRRTGFEWRRSDASPIRRVLFEGAGEFQRTNFESAMFVQDSWRVRPHVLLELGVRTDWDRVLGNWTASPRSGIAWSPAGSENTRLSAGYTITYDATNLELFARPHDQFPVTFYFTPQGDYREQPVRSLFALGDRRLLSPRFHNLSFAADHRIGPNLFIHAQAMRRRGKNGLAYLGVPSAGPDFRYELANARGDRYDSLELTLRQNFRHEYSWLASYVRSRARSTAALDLSADTALLVDENAGRLPWDAPHRYISWGYLPTFFRTWAVAYLAEYRSGFPFSVQNESGQIQGGVNSWSYPDFFELNLHLEKRFHFRGQRWALRMGANNILNRSNPNVVNNNVDSPHFLTYYGGQRRAFNFRIRWLGKI